MEQTANVRFKLTVSQLKETGGFSFSGLPFSGGFVFGSACLGVYPQFSGVFVFVATFCFAFSLNVNRPSNGYLCPVDTKTVYDVEINAVSNSVFLV